MLLVEELEHLLLLMRQVYRMAFLKEIKGEKVCNDQKLFFIYELHTDIVVKGGREVQFGHKVNMSTGKSKLILTCQVLKDNPSDSTPFRETIDRVITVYGIVPRDSVTDGDYAPKINMKYAQSQSIANVVFNKIVGGGKVTSSKNLEIRLKKWRSGMEAVISNFKRGFNIFRCNRKGEAHFDQKVLWSAIAYNVRVMTAMVLS